MKLRIYQFSVSFIEHAWYYHGGEEDKEHIFCGLLKKKHKNNHSALLQSINFSIN